MGFALLNLWASFALPLVAAGAVAAAVALPVLIHLLSRQRYQVVRWAAIRFLLASQKRHRRRIDRWLLLILRVLSLFLPLLAMLAVTPWAERAWQRVTPGRLEAVSNLPRTHHILVIDGSLSMTAVVEDTTRFQRALEQSEQFVNTMSAGDGYTLIYLTSQANVIIPGPTNDRDKVIAEIQNLKVTHGLDNYPAALVAVGDALTRSPRHYPRRQVTFFGDLQRTAWQAVLPKADATTQNDLWQRIQAQADVVVMDGSRESADNLAVVEMTLADPLALVNSPNAVLVNVHNYGRTDRKNVKVELRSSLPTNASAESTLSPIGTQTIETLPSGQRATAVFLLKDHTQFREPGMYLLQARLTDGDANDGSRILPVDDVRSLTVNVRESLPVLVVHEKANINDPKRFTDYLTIALDPRKSKLVANPARPRAVSLAEFNDPQLTDLSKYDCVFLCDVPSFTLEQVARLEAHLQRGGGLVIGLGPNAEANKEHYNRVLYDRGRGLLPGQLLDLKTSANPDVSDYRFAADDAAYRLDPLSAFRNDDARVALAGTPFKSYVRMDAPPDGRARRILSFVPAKPDVTKPNEKPDPAIIEWSRHRGRVIVFGSTFHNDWTDWPVLPSYLPMMHELLRHAATNPDRHTIRVGDMLEELAPNVAVGNSATITTPDGTKAEVKVADGDTTGVIRYPDTTLSGIYHVIVNGKMDSTFAVNVPDSSTGAGSESDLTRLEPSRLSDISKRIQVVSDASDLKFDSTEGLAIVQSPRPHGPTLARWLLTIALFVLVFEVWFAWNIGPSRARIGSTEAPTQSGSTLGRVCWNALGILPLVLGLAALAIVLHAEYTGHFLGFFPQSAQANVERVLGVPSAGPGEGTRMRLESVPPYFNNLRNNRRLLVGLVAFAAIMVAGLYWFERRGAGRLRYITVPAFLRISAILIVGFILLPQMRISFEREGWPDLVILLDTSASMATVDELQDPAVQAKASELMGGTNLGEVDRLRLARQLLTQPKHQWLERLLKDKEFKVHIYSMSDQAQLIASIDEPSEIANAREAIGKAEAKGESSRQADAVLGALKAFRGGSLAGIVAFTDGVITAGEDWPRASQEAARAGVPLYLVGLGESRDALDLALSETKVSDVVVKGDQLIFETRLTSRGPGVPRTVPVILWERQGEKLVERGRQDIVTDPNGKPVPVRFTHSPQEIGEKSFIIEVPVQQGESETNNNRVERTVLVTDTKSIKVLYVEGYPRYEFRFVKALFERETEAGRRQRSIELDVLWLDASAGHWQLDKSTERLRGVIPTKTQLMNYEVVIIGDLNPNQLPKSNTFFNDLVEYVRESGGGLVFLAGEQATPHKLYDTPLADLLPIVPTESALRAGHTITPENPGRVDTYRPLRTALGRSHALFRFTSDETDNDRIWNGLPGMYWYAGGYHKKPSAEVLATHPAVLAGGDATGKHPIVLQQFFGKGRVMFIGFDETWRWRFRSSEERFQQFWNQLITSVSKHRIHKIELKTDKQTAYRQGEPIRLTVKYPDDMPAPGPEIIVKVQIQRKPPGKSNSEPERSTIQLTKVDGQRATYEALISRAALGDYTFVMTQGFTIPDVNPPRAEARVLPPPGERDRLEMNRSGLTRAADESRGKFYTLANVHTLIDDLPTPTRVPLNLPCPPLSVWDHVGMFTLLAAMLALEWWLRRRERLT